MDKIKRDPSIYELVDTDDGLVSERRKVPGGWHVRETFCYRDNVGAGSTSVAVLFYPDPNHEWEIN